MPSPPLQTAFERQARAFLGARPHIQHEWRDVTSGLTGDRRELVCAAGAANEIFASLSDSQLTVGLTHGDHDDFEDFGRGLSDEAVADEAFRHFVALLTSSGHLDPAA